MHNNGDSGLTLKNLSVYYGSLKVVRDVTFEVPEGKIVSLLGANGSGKSTILRTVSSLKKPTAGEIWFQGMRIDLERPGNIIKSGIAHVPERRGLFPYMSVYENLLMGAYSRGNVAKKELAYDLEAVYQYFPVLKSKREKTAATLSGGEAELLAIARALMSKPKLLLMDEPLQGIAPVVVEQIAKLIIELKNAGITILMVEHNIAMAFELSDWVCIMDTGRLETQGEPHTLSKTGFVRKSYLGV